MSKSKKSQRSKRKNSGKQYIQEQFRSLKSVLDAGNRRGSEPGAYRQVLSLSDEVSIREYENRLSTLEKRIFRTWLLCSVPHSVITTERMDSFLARLMAGDEVTFRSIMVISILGAIHELLYSDGKSGLPEFENIETAAARFGGSIKKRFRNLHVDTYYQQICALPYADPLLMRMGCMVDWKEVLSGNNLAAWSKNCLGIIESFATEEQLLFLKQRRDGVFLDLANLSIALIKETMDNVVEEIRSSGIPYAYPTDLSAANLTRFSERISPMKLPKSFSMSLPGDSCSAFPSNMYTSDVYNEVLCECTIARLACGLEFEGIALHITNAFSQVEILYAALAAMAGCRAIATAPAVLHALFAALAFSGFAGNVVDYGYTERDLRRCIILNTGKLTALTEKQRTAFVQAVPGKNGEIVRKDTPVAQSVNLAQFIYTSTGMIVPPTLSVHLRDARTLESFGLTRTEAIALAGYLDGLRGTHRIINGLTEIYRSSAWLEDASEKGSEISEETRREQIRQEVAAELANEINAAEQLRANSEIAQRKLMREHRTASYRAEKAERRIKELTAEIECFRKETAALSVERDELQNTLLAVTEQEKETETEKPLKAHFPMEIGKSINFVVFGGPQNWAAEQRRRFPNISFYDVDVMPNETVVENADILMLNTFVMQHTYFRTIQSAARRANVPIRYFTNKGINRGSEQIIEAYRSYMDAGKQKIVREY